MDDYNSHTIIYRAVFIKATTATPPFRHLSPNRNISKGGICCGSQPQRRNLLRLTAAKAEFVAAHSRKHLRYLPIVLSEAMSDAVPHIPSPAPLPPQCKTLSVSPALCLPPHKVLLRADGFQ